MLLILVHILIVVLVITAGDVVHPLLVVQVPVDGQHDAVIRDIKKKIALLFDWIAEAKAELAKPQAPDLVSLLNAYYTSRRAGAYSQKGKVSNLKEMNETFNYLRANGIYSLEDLEHRVSEHSAATESLKKTLDEQTARMKAIKQLYDS